MLRSMVSGEVVATIGANPKWTERAGEGGSGGREREPSGGFHKLRPQDTSTQELSSFGNGPNGLFWVYLGVVKKWNSAGWMGPDSATKGWGGGGGVGGVATSGVQANSFFNLLFGKGSGSMKVNPKKDARCFHGYWLVPLFWGWGHRDFRVTSWFCQTGEDLQ